MAMIDILRAQPVEPAPPMLIVIAWTTMHYAHRCTQKRGHAVTWLMEGDESDVEKAVAHAKSLGLPWTVYVHPADAIEGTPLDDAKYGIVHGAPAYAAVRSL